MTQGVQSIGAITLGGAWGDTEVSATNRIPLLDETVNGSFEQYRSQILGSASQHRSHNGFRTPAGAINCELDLGYTLELLQAALGATRVSSGTYYEMANTLPVFSLAVQKGSQVFYSGRHKVSRLTLSHRVNEIAKLSVDVVGRTVSRATASLSGLSVPASDPCTWESLRVRVADKANAMDAGDEVDVSGFELQIDNALEAGYGSASASPIEPERNGFRVGTLSLDLPRGGVGNFATWRDAGTPLQFDILWATGTANLIIGGFTAYVSQGGDVPVPGPGVLVDTIQLDITRGVNIAGDFALAQGDMIYAKLT